MRNFAISLFLILSALFVTQVWAAPFTDNGNGTVTDAKTGLMWQQGEPGYMTWPGALNYCENLELPSGSGQNDWRLPNIKELESITDDAVYNPAIDMTFFPNASASDYWSSTTNAYNPNNAWYVNFSYGHVYYSSKNGSMYVRCVRAGQAGSFYNLIISKSGTGSGTVTATGIDCGVDCDETYDEGTVVTLTATPDAGSTFAGWSGDADCSDGSVTMDADKSCTATFLRIHSISGTVMTGGSRTTPGGTPIPSVTITGSGGCSGTTTTDGNGNYTLPGIPDGSVCTVTPSKAGYGFTPVSRAVNMNGANVTGQNFTGLFTGAPTYSLSGRVTTGGNPLPNVTITGSGGCSGTTTTDGSGNYTLPGISNNSLCKVTPSMAGYVFTPTSRTVTINGANVTGQDFAGAISTATYSISGTVMTRGSRTTPGVPVQNVTLTLGGDAAGVAKTDARGNYMFTGLSNGNYTVTPFQSMYTFTPVNRNVTINNANVTGQDFTRN